MIKVYANEYLLKKEWAGNREDVWCPECLCRPNTGHSRGCTLARALSSLGERPYMYEERSSSEEPGRQVDSTKDDPLILEKEINEAVFGTSLEAMSIASLDRAVSSMLKESKVKNWVPPKHLTHVPECTCGYCPGLEENPQSEPETP